MRLNQAREIVSKLRGYWPTPAMSEDEVNVWTDALTDPQRPSRFDDVMKVISRLSSTEQFRPRAGSVMQLAKQYRADTPMTNCPECGGSGMREMLTKELPCHRGDDCTWYVESCRCVVTCTRCDRGKVAWAPDPGGKPNYGEIASRRVGELRELIASGGIKRVPDEKF